MQQSASMDPAQQKQPGEVSSARRDRVRARERVWFGRLAFVGKMLPPYAASLPAPVGFETLEKAWRLPLSRAGEWGVSLGWQSINLRHWVADLISHAGADGRIRLPGIVVATGRLVWIPAETWRVPGLYGTVHMAPAQAACRGKLIRLPSPLSLVVQPLIAERDLANLVGALNPPPPPTGDVLQSFEQLAIACANPGCGGHEATLSAMPNEDTAMVVDDITVDVADIRDTSFTSHSTSRCDAEIAVTAMGGIEGTAGGSVNNAGRDLCGEVSKSEENLNGSTNEIIVVTTVAGYRLGVGRPSSRPLLMAEFDRLASNEECPPVLSRLTAQLSEWLKREHPEKPQMTQKTVENALRELRGKHLEQLYPAASVGGQRHGVVRRFLPPEQHRGA